MEVASNHRVLPALLKQIMAVRPHGSSCPGQDVQINAGGSGLGAATPAGESDSACAAAVAAAVKSAAASSHKHLCLFVNGTRRAAWDAKLGFQAGKAFRVAVASLVPGGGTAPCVDVLVARRWQGVARWHGQSLLLQLQLQLQMHLQRG